MPYDLISTLQNATTSFIPSGIIEINKNAFNSTTNKCISIYGQTSDVSIKDLRALYVYVTLNVNYKEYGDLDIS